MDSTWGKRGNKKSQSNAWENRMKMGMVKVKMNTNCKLAQLEKRQQKTTASRFV